MTARAVFACFQNAARASLSLFTQALVFWRIYDLHVEILPRNGREKNKRKSQLLACRTTGENNFFFLYIRLFWASRYQFPSFCALLFLATVFFGFLVYWFGFRAKLCLKILLRRLKRQRHFNAFLQTKARLFQLDQFVECRRILAGLNSWGSYPSTKKEGRNSSSGVWLLQKTAYWEISRRSFNFFNPCPSLPSVSTNGKKHFQCLNMVLNNKTGSLFWNTIGTKYSF